MKGRYLSVLIIAMNLSLNGCGKGDSKNAPHDPIVSPEIKEFPLEDLDLKINSVFLWKKDVNKDQVDQMSFYTYQFGMLKLLLPKKQYLEQNLAKLETGLKQVLGAIAQIDKALMGNSEQLKRNEAEIQKLNEEKLKEEEKIRDQPGSDDTRLKEIIALLAEKDREKSNLNQEKEGLQKQLSGYQVKRAELEQNLAKVKAGLNLVQIEISKVIGEQNPEDYKRVLEQQKIPQASDLFSSPDLISVRNGSGGILIKIVNWKLGSSSKNFSTDDQTISDVKYTVRGGQLSFIVDIDHEYRYEFKISRNKYNKISDGIISFYGNIVRVNKVNGEKRFGIASFWVKNES